MCFVHGRREFSDFGGEKSIKGIYNFHEVKIALGRKGPGRWTHQGGARANPWSFTIFGHYSTPYDLKLIELPVKKKSNIGNFFQQNRSPSTFIKKKKIANSRCLKLLRGTCLLCSRPPPLSIYLMRYHKEVWKKNLNKFLIWIVFCKTQ